MQRAFFLRFHRFSKREKSYDPGGGEKENAWEENRKSSFILHRRRDFHGRDVALPWRKS